MLFLLLVLKMSPYQHETDDWSNSLTAITLSLSMLFGFALASDKSDMTNQSSNNNFDASFFSFLLVCMTVLCVFVQVCIMTISSTKYGKDILEKRAEAERVARLNRVHPLHGNTPQEDLQDAIESLSVKKIRGRRLERDKKKNDRVRNFSLSDIIYPFDRPLTLIYIFNIVYFRLNRKNPSACGRF
jgi:hypothetical protein